MAKTAYTGALGAARKISKIYFGVDGVAKEVKAAYTGVDGSARQWWENEPESTILCHCDRTSGGLLVDEKGHPFTNPASHTGAKYSSSGGKFKGYAYQGASGTDSGKAYSYFSGIGDDLYIGMNDFTLDFWTKWPSKAPLSTYNNELMLVHLAEVGSLSTEVGISRYQIADYQKITVRARTTNGSYMAFTTRELLFDDASLWNKWVHLAFVRQGLSSYFYVNGVRKATFSARGAFNTGQMRVFGGYNSTECIDEVRFVNGKAIWTADFEPPAEPYAK